MARSSLRWTMGGSVSFIDRCALLGYSGDEGAIAVRIARVDGRRGDKALAADARGSRAWFWSAWAPRARRAASGACMPESTIYDWGQTPNLAPSIKRASPLSWIAASCFFGVAAAVLGLILVWRPILWLPAPPGPLFGHLAMLCKLGLHGLSPFFFGADSRIYLGWLSKLTDSERVALGWRAAWAAWCFVMPWIALAPSYLRGRDGLIHLRGSTRLSGAEAVAGVNRMLAPRVKRRPDHEIAPGVPYPADLWTRHVLLVAGTGAGKSTVLRPLIDKVVKAKEQMLLFDPKSEFTSGFIGPYLIAPWDERSLSWDIAKDMRNVLDMRRFAAAMIKESQDPMWSNASRQLLVGLMIYLKATRRLDWGWLELRDLIALPQANLLEIMKRWHPEAIRAVEKASVTTAGILINLASFCSAITDLAEAWGDVPRSRRISFVEWTQGRSRFKQVILQGHGAYGELTKSYVEGIVGILSAIVNSVEMEDDPKRKIWFIADEFAQIKMPVRPLFEVGRSRGVRCVVACQDFAQLEEMYGAPMVKALVGMCGTLIVGQIMQGETAELLCKAFGAREVERANTSSSSAGGGTGGSTTLSFNRDEVPLYKPSELTSRLGLTADGSGVVMMLFTGGHAFELKWPIFQMKKVRAAHKPAPWTLGAGMDWSASSPAAPTSIPMSPPQQSGKDAEPESESKDRAMTDAATVVESAPPAIDMGAVDGAFIQDLGSHEGAGVSERHPAAEPLHEDPQRPKEEIVVQVVEGSTPASGQEHGAEPIFDAAAELAAIRLGLGPVGVAVELATALDAASLPPNAPRQRVHMGQAQRGASPGGRHMP